MRQKLNTSSQGIKVGDMLIKDSRFADQIDFLAESEATLRNLTRIAKTSRACRMEISSEKKKIMVTGQNDQLLANTITANTEELEQVPCKLCNNEAEPKAGC